MPAAPVPPAPSFLIAPLPHIGAWTHYFLNAEIPILASTAQALEELRAKEDDVDANKLTAVIQVDPLMTLKLLARIASLRRLGSATETESITTSLVLMGISPFFRHFGPQRTVEDWLANQPEAMQGLQNLLIRAERAGQFALGFAVHRADTDATIIHQAAFLNDFAEILLWLHAPTLMVKIQQAQAADSTLRSSVIQREVLGVEISDLRQALMNLWHLPELLIHISDERHAERSNVQCVVLAVRLARHSANGWENAALPDDYEAIAKLLNASPRVIPAFLHKIDHPILEAAMLG
ncbi:MAG: HDOD domain-containing protein [Rhodoferax sp.]|nr:HDOD domain-containing protein [Betaproteobacteria bacterium]NCN96354.1 HDOD domain-containing protein [Rhodoferax sp.]OIP13550.1 MAG: histidine kinase [Comamonadaceae bacterium CG2_30_57_122]PIZ21623.1 MAG: histidine kinase [Comamonadaceae bacterium CG_4_10_14_0_8_um_filter_57_29]PJC22898.1 MAG: histidine kinase [Comamonadaceae bacterium CG_4_9_14_0_8_um_filter_57_21]